MQIYVRDACAMIAYLWGEAGGSKVSSILANSPEACYAHSVNLCEVYYQVLRRSDEATARQAISDLRKMGVIERSDIDETFWEKIARLKSQGRISIADCFCLALAMEVGGQLVTTDHHEFDALVPLGLCPILFIR
jgi:PIN domain nuclease of toxin-antitoxin system